MQIAGTLPSRPSLLKVQPPHSPFPLNLSNLTLALFINMLRHHVLLQTEPLVEDRQRAGHHVQLADDVVQGAGENLGELVFVEGRTLVGQDVVRQARGGEVLSVGWVGLGWVGLDWLVLIGL